MFFFIYFAKKWNELPVDTCRSFDREGFQKEVTVLYVSVSVLEGIYAILSFVVCIGNPHHCNQVQSRVYIFIFEPFMLTHLCELLNTSQSSLVTLREGCYGMLFF